MCIRDRIRIDRVLHCRNKLLRSGCKSHEVVAECPKSVDCRRDHRQSSCNVFIELQWVDAQSQQRFTEGDERDVVARGFLRDRSLGKRSLEDDVSMDSQFTTNERQGLAEAVDHAVWIRSSNGAKRLHIEPFAHCSDI